MLRSWEMDNLKYWSTLSDIINGNVSSCFKTFSQIEYSANEAIASVSHPIFKMKWVPKQKKEHMEAWKIKFKEKQNAERTDSNIKETETKEYKI